MKWFLVLIFMSSGPKHEPEYVIQMPQPDEMVCEATADSLFNVLSEGGAYATIECVERTDA